MSEPIFITGATGNVGSEVVEILCVQGSPVRAGIHRADAIERFNAEHGPGSEAVPFDFTKPETFAPALRGVKRMFLVRPPQIANVKQRIAPVLDAAKEAGVAHVVFLSIINVDQNKQVPHYKIEQYIQECGLDYTFLRASFFMQNLHTTHREEIRDRNEIFVPVGGAKTSFIDVRDIAAVAALPLTEEGHANRAYELTGREALDYYEVAALFTEILGRTITYRNPSALRYFWHSVRRGRSLPFALITTWLYSSTRSGMAARVTPTVAELLGRAPITLRQYVEDYRHYWMR